MGKISLQRRLVTTKLFRVDFSKILPSNLDCLWVDQTFAGLALGNNEKTVHLREKTMHLRGGVGGGSPITTLGAGEVGRRGETGGKGAGHNL